MIFEILYLASPFLAIAGWASVLFLGMAGTKPEWLWVGGGAVAFLFGSLYFVGYSFGLFAGWIPALDVSIQITKE